MAAVGPFGMGPMELVVILLVLVMLFGATRLADLGGSLGKGIKEFRTAVKDEDPAEPTDAASASVLTPASNGAAEVPGAVAAVKCSSCGALNEVGAKHCNQCGVAIAAPVS
jgi:sec-independent protein translocase protein TatA